MLRWLIRFSAAALIGALLVWLWNRYNEDLLEEDLEEEIPLEFDVAAEDGPVAALVSDSTDGTAAADAPAGVAAEDNGGPSNAVETATAAAETAETTDTTTGTETASTETDTAAEDSESNETTMLDSPAPTPEGAGDNVIAIKGIGPKYGAKLAEMGITTFGALLATPMADLEMAFPRVSTEELQNWLEQARELAAQENKPD
jgi:predicted flap endonuclease-1-like 5' DNA nuclease